MRSTVSPPFEGIKLAIMCFISLQVKKRGWTIRTFEKETGISCASRKAIYYSQADKVSICRLIGALESMGYDIEIKVSKSANDKGEVRLDLCDP